MAPPPARRSGVRPFRQNLLLRAVPAGDQMLLVLTPGGDLVGGKGQEVGMVAGEGNLDDQLAVREQMIRVEVPPRSRTRKVPLTALRLDLHGLDEGPVTGQNALANAAGVEVAGFRWASPPRCRRSGTATRSSSGHRASNRAMITGNLFEVVFDWQSRAQRGHWPTALRGRRGTRPGRPEPSTRFTPATRRSFWRCRRGWSRTARATG